MANDDRTALRAQVTDLTAEVASLKQQLVEAGEAAVENYVAHFHETAEYDGLGLYWRNVAYGEVLARVAELHPEVDLTAVREEFIPAEPSTPADEVVEEVAEEVVEVVDGGK